MKNRFNLPDIDFLEKDPDLIDREMLLVVEEKTGLTLQRADPRRKFLQALTTYISIERNRLEHALRQNRLAYAEDDTLEHMGAEMSTERLLAKAAITTMAFLLEPDRVDVLVIEKGTQFLVGENTYFATDEALVVPIGENIVTVGATCTEPGDMGNDYLVGEISTLVQPLPWVNSVKNTTVSSGGTEQESDDAYAERIRLAPESFSVAGPELAYVYWAKAASADIVDVHAYSPQEGRVAVYLLMKDGRLPTEMELNATAEIINDKKVRPLTDHVVFHAPEPVEYDALATYWIAQENAAVASIIQRQVEEEFNNYLVWQRSKIGRDIDLSELIARLKQKGASRVAVDAAMFMEVLAHQVAFESPTSALTFGGLANE